MTSANPFVFARRLEQVRAALPAGLPAYLVGGAVRDALLGCPTHDLDFVLPRQGLEMARRVANTLGGAYYPLDEARDTGRVVLVAADGEREMLDFSVLRGPDLESDLRARDFTLNAIAIALEAPLTLIDPLGGAADLRNRQLRACAPTAFLDDPLRILRGVRLSAALHCRLLPETSQAMRQAVIGLARVSPERLRDELFKLLDSPQPAASLRVLDLFGALQAVLPELAALKGVVQSSPHVWDVWEHTLSVVQKLDGLLNVLAPQPDPDSSANLTMGLIVLQLGRFREQLAAHLGARLNPARSLRSLLFLAALYHDIGKPQTRRVEAGRVRFFEHDDAGAALAQARGRALRLSGEENDRFRQIVAYHLRPLHLVQTGRPPTRRAIYRFFRAAGPSGVDVCLLSLADALGTYETSLPQELWNRHLEVVRALLEAWWEHPSERVDPQPLVSGRDLMADLALPPGPEIGWLLEAIREAQAAGQVGTRAEALALAKALLEDPDRG